MLAFQPHRGADESQVGIPARNSRPRPADVPDKLEAVEPPKTAAPQDDPQVLADWGRVISELPLSGANKLLAANCAYLQRKGDTVYLGLDRRSESLLTRSRQQAIADALTDKFSKRLRVEISLATSAGDTVSAETPMQAEARRSDEKLEAARESLESDPNVKALRDMFGAELNPDSIELIDDRAVSNPVDRKRVDNPRSATRE
ncbi:MAG: DNA polymerase III subunit gamma/tau C-terminal domain-containing protein, partial [Woeseiaceae bacterium]